MKLIKWIVGNQTLIDRIWDMNSLIHDTIMVRQDLSFFEYLLIDGYTNSLWRIQNVGATSYDFSYRVRDFAPHYNFCRHIKLQKTHLIMSLDSCQRFSKWFGPSFYLENRLERLPIISKKCREESRTWAQIAKKSRQPFFAK